MRETSLAALDTSGSMLCINESIDRAESIESTDELLFLCVCDSHMSSGHEASCEQIVINFYYNVMNKKKRIPYYSEVLSDINEYNDEIFYRLAIIDFNSGQCDLSDFDEDDTPDTIIDSLRFQWEEFFYYNWCQNLEAYICKVMNKYHMAYIVEDGEIPFEELNIEKVVEFMIKQKDDCRVIINDCQNILLFEMAPHAIVGNDIYINVTSPDFMIKTEGGLLSSPA